MMFAWKFPIVPLWALCAAFVVGQTKSYAGTFTLNSFDNGWYTESGIHYPIINGTIVGYSAGNIFRNWFAFDLSAVSGASVVSASITFAANGNYDSPDANETFGLFDFGGHMQSLLQGTGGYSVYEDLGSGDFYGQAVIDRPVDGAMPAVTINLTPAALADILATINTADKRFVIGGVLLSMSASRTIETLYSGSSLRSGGALTIVTSDTPAATPLPAALTLFATGLGVLGLIAHRGKPN